MKKQTERKVSGKPVACECGGRLLPTRLDAFDFSDYAGFAVTVHNVDGLRCNKCHGETIPGAMINAVLNYLVVHAARQPRRLNGDEAQHLRRYMGATQQELATRMGIVRETVAKCVTAPVSTPGPDPGSGSRR